MLEMRKDLFAEERDDNLNEIGKPTQRQDMLGHVTGRTRFFDDHAFDGLLHMKVLRSPHHHARIRNIDTSAAERMEGVRRVIRAADVPVNLNTLLSLIGFGEDDEPSLASLKVRYRGEPIIAVIADTEAQAYDAVAAIRVDYEVLPHVLEVEEALKPGAPSVNDTYPGNFFVYHERYDRQKLRFGDVEAGFAQADHVVEERYQMSPIEHAPTETNGCIAAPETNDRVVVHTSTQALFFSLGTAAKINDMPSNRLHFIGGTVGGGFGGKVDTLTEPLAILGCRLTGRPVRYVFNRPEEMQAGPPRGAEVHYIKDGVMSDGRIVARQVRSYFDGGAYTRLSSYAVHKCAAHIPGPYTIPNVKSDTFCVYTNRTPATAMRGFGVTGVDFALECQMDRLAHLVGMDPIEFRILNAYRDGDMKAHRREAKNCALIECCQVAAEKAGWPIREEFKQMSSMVGGGGERARIPDTPGDREGIISGPGARPQAPVSAPPPQPTTPAPQPAYAAPPPPPPPPVQPAPQVSAPPPAAAAQVTPPAPASPPPGEAPRYAPTSYPGAYSGSAPSSRPPQPAQAAQAPTPQLPQPAPAAQAPAPPPQQPEPPRPASDQYGAAAPPPGAGEQRRYAPTSYPGQYSPPQPRSPQSGIGGSATSISPVAMSATPPPPAPQAPPASPAPVSSPPPVSSAPSQPSAPPASTPPAAARPPAAAAPPPPSPPPAASSPSSRPEASPRPGARRHGAPVSGFRRR